ncbi:amino acid transporter [Neorhizobium sp. SOG26]|uniref:LysE family translocator n=1 Tax=Neorhizobium sp. SOG26 TaxID=2060726 RepID=UPI000E586439|nr:LysE family translocator [Neorhizobium sp. SOG26]AXV16739.1 amino acid transporter [Neorhizobium sp. SOG26]
MPDVFVYLPHIWPAYVAFLIAVLSPGPANFAIMGTAISEGRRAGLIIALGIFCGSLTWAISAALGLAAILRTYAVALEVMKIFGGLYLIYLAWKAYKSARRSDALQAVAETEAAPRTARQLWLRGYAIHVTNPKAIFGWLAIISLGLPVNPPTSAIVLIVGMCSTTSLLVFTGYAMLFSTQRALRVYKSARRWIEATMAVVYSLAGFKLLTSRI